MEAESDDLYAALARMRLITPGDSPKYERLTGGVSSDIWVVYLPSGPICVKRALPRLRVAAEWVAPIERNVYEMAWIEIASSIVPEAVPAITGHDPGSGMFAMTFLKPSDYPVWKSLLRNGIANSEIAAAVAQRLVRIHAETADDPTVAISFQTDQIFHSIRLEPYLLATARVHPDRAAALQTLAEVTANTKRALVHGDVSPKNLLIGPSGPVFLDAECAWYGDPAFDIAFCLNHLLLKCLLVPRAAVAFLHCFGVMAATYLSRVDWEPRDIIEGRAARLLSGLFLARVDGKSPVEYITDDTDKNQVRRVARDLLAQPPERLYEVRAAWAKELGI